MPVDGALEAPYPEPQHVLVHLSDLHLRAGRARLYDKVDTAAFLERAVSQLRLARIHPGAIIVTGDIADRGEPDAYAVARNALFPLAEELGTRLIWSMGNHDLRSSLRGELLGSRSDDDPTATRGDRSAVSAGSTAAPLAPIDTVAMVDGLRIVTLDTSVPGYHHGDLEDSQLDWLRTVLEVRAPHGTVLAMHHPPLPTPVRLMRVLELRRQTELARILEGSDVRAILAGHLHYATAGLFAGVPVHAAGATSYTIDVSAPPRELRGIGGGQSFQLVSVYPDQVVTAIVPLGAAEVVAHFGEDYLDGIESLDAQARLEEFSRIPDETDRDRVRDHP